MHRCQCRYQLTIHILSITINRVQLFRHHPNLQSPSHHRDQTNDPPISGHKQNCLPSHDPSSIVSCLLCHNAPFPCLRGTSPRPKTIMSNSLRPAARDWLLFLTTGKFPIELYGSCPTPAPCQRCRYWPQSRERAFSHPVSSRQILYQLRSYPHPAMPQVLSFPFARHDHPCTFSANGQNLNLQSSGTS